MSFAELKKARSARHASIARAVNVQPDTANSTLDNDSRAREFPIDNSEPYEDKECLYKGIGELFEVRVNEMGRGIYVKRGTQAPIKAGSTVLKVRPLVSVLSTRSITSHCSYCHTEEGSPNSTALKRCTMCKVVWYDSTTCQNNDWRVHKYECTALRKWGEKARQAGRGSDNPDVIVVPSDAIRALGRILWNIELDGLSSFLAREVQQMQSHRLSLSPKSTAHSALASLGQSLAKYLSLEPSGFSKWGISSSADLVDFLSKFTTNSFTLTTPSLSPIGVCVSPPAALVNHSCSPNAVIVFPETEAFAPPQLTIVALRDLHPGEQLLASYVDITLPRQQRHTELEKTYFFDCKCSACISPDVDPRQSFLCRNCSALTPFNDADVMATDRPITCNQCNKSLVSSENELRNAVKVAQEGHADASGLQITDPVKALKYTSSALSLLHPFPLHLSSDPLLAVTRLHLSLLIHQLSALLSSEAATLAEQDERDTAVDEACRLCARCVAGVSGILSHGHPIRGIALAEFGKLLCVDVSPGPANEPSALLESGSNCADPPPPRGASRLHLAARTLISAKEELMIGFGRSNGGGQVGSEVAKMLRELEREMNIWRKTQSRGTGIPTPA